MWRIENLNRIALDNFVFFELLKQNNLIKNKCELFFNLIKIMIEIINGCVFVNGEETTNAELIGFAVLDFSETTKNDILSITMKEGDVFIDDYKNAKIYL